MLGGMRRIVACMIAIIWASASLAEGPVVEAVETERLGMTWRFHVTLSHPDSGWDHYADGWEIVDAEGNRLGHRELLHPHEQEQPFTRSLSNVMLPDGARVVFVRARCSRDGWSDRLVPVEMPL